MIAIKGGTIVTVAAEAIPNGTILVEGDVIVRVGNNFEIPTSCEIVDASGCYVTPGLIDAHCHVGIEEEIYQVEGSDLNETSDPVTPQLQAVDGINFLDLAFSDAVKGGVTRLLVSPGSANVVGGQAVLLKSWSPKVSEMVYRNPWGLKAALGENPKRVYGQRNKAPKTRMASASLLREALFTARKLEEKDTKEPGVEYKYQALTKVIRREMPLWLHAHRADDILTALRLKDEFGIDMVLVHGTEAFMVADEIARRGVAVCLGPLLVNRAKVEMKEVSFRNAALLNKAGVKFCLITDHPVVPIQYLSACAALTVKEGLDEDSALKALTLNSAEILGVGDELGTLEVGKKADIVIFDGHPLELKSRVSKVMVDGILWEGTG